MSMSVSMSMSISMLTYMSTSMSIPRSMLAFTSMSTPVSTSMCFGMCLAVVRLAACNASLCEVSLAACIQCLSVGIATVFLQGFASCLPGSMVDIMVNESDVELPEPPGESSDESNLQLPEEVSSDSSSLELPEVDLDSSGTELPDASVGLVAPPRSLQHMCRDDLCEIFSLPRIVPTVHRLQLPLRAEVSIDIMNGYDLRWRDSQRAVWAMLQERRPRATILSPPCTMFSCMMNANFKKMKPMVVKHRWDEALVLLNFALDVIQRLRAQGDIYVLEHPTGASSWHLPQVKALLLERDSLLATFDQCRFGLQSPSGKPVRKSTRLLTNSQKVMEQFNKVRCQCKCAHCVIEGSEAGHKLSVWCQHYPAPFCDALVRAIAEEILGRA